MCPGSFIGDKGEQQLLDHKAPEDIVRIHFAATFYAHDKGNCHVSVFFIKK